MIGLNTQKVLTKKPYVLLSEKERLLIATGLERRRYSRCRTQGDYPLLQTRIAVTHRDVARKLILPLAIMLPAVGARFTSADDASIEQVLQQHTALINQQKAILERQQRALEAQEQEIRQLRERLDQQGIPAADVASRSGADQPPLPTGPVGQAPPVIKDSTALDIPRIADNVGGVLTGKGKFILEPSLQYSYADNNRVFLDGFTFLPSIAIGLIDLREIKRHTSIFSLAGRYGLTSRLEAELRVPYVYRKDSQRSRPISIGVGEDEIFEADGEGLGDIELALRYQLNEGRDGWPVFIANLIGSVDTGSSPFNVEFVQSTPGAVFPTELPTGAGYISLQSGLSLLYPTDPGVFFGNVSYTWNEETDEIIAGIERTVDPGDAIGLGFGMGFALNDRSSFNIGYSHRHVFASKTDNADINGSVLDIGQLTVGYSLRASTTARYNLSLNIGTTDDAQNVGLTFRMPMAF